MQEMLFQDFVQLKRTYFWVLRFVRIDRRHLSYSDEPRSTKFKFWADVKSLRVVNEYTHDGLIVLVLQSVAGKVKFSFSPKERAKYNSFRAALEQGRGEQKDSGIVLEDSLLRQPKADPEPMYLHRVPDLVQGWVVKDNAVETELAHLKACFRRQALHLVQGRLRVFRPFDEEAKEQSSLLLNAKKFTKRIGAVYSGSLLTTLFFLVFYLLANAISQFGAAASATSLLITAVLLRKTMQALWGAKPIQIERYFSLYELNFSVFQVLVALRQQDTAWRLCDQRASQVLTQRDGEFRVLERLRTGCRLILVSRSPFGEQACVKMYSEGLPRDYEFISLLQLSLAHNRLNPSSELNRLAGEFLEEQHQPLRPASKQADVVKEPLPLPLHPLEEQAGKLKAIYLQSYSGNFTVTETDGVQKGTYQSSRGFLCTKSEGVVEYQLERVFKFLSNPQLIREYDGQINKIQLLEAISQEVQVRYMKYNGIFPVSPRDFVNLFWRARKEQEAFIICRSIQRPEHQPDPKAVRGQVHIGGFYLREEGAGKTRVVYLQEVNLNGSVPKTIMNGVAKMQTEVVVKLKRLIKQSMKD